MTPGVVLSDQAMRLHFLCLDRDQQRHAIRRLVAIGYSEDLIANVTGWSVEMVRRLLTYEDGAL